MLMRLRPSALTRLRPAPGCRNAHAATPFGADAPSACAWLSKCSQDEILGGVGQRFGAARGDHDRVFDADAADTGEIDARLDGDDVADEQRITSRRRDTGRFMDL